MTKTILIIFVGVVLLVGLFFAFIPFDFKQFRLGGDNSDEVVCTMDAMICPDGSSVGRVGPKCEFSACPVSDNESSATSSGVVINSPGPLASGMEITVKGEMICLPHRDTKGPHTMECAFGLKGNDGKNYGLTDPGWKFLIGVPMNVSVTVTGKLLSGNHPTYDSVGTIEISELVRD